MRHILLLSLLGICVATHCVACSDEQATDGAGPQSSSQVEHSLANASECDIDGDHLPWLTYLQRLGAAEGGVWGGKAPGARVILYLGKSGRREDSYLAVIWESKAPALRLFEVWDFAVDLEGGVFISLWPVEGHRDVHGSLLVFGQYTSGSFSLTEVQFDELDSLPAPITLERTELDDEAKQLRARFKRKTKEE